MKAKLQRPSPAMIVALLALFVALGGSAYGLSANGGAARSIAPRAARSGDLGRLRLRAGKIVDFDTTAGDGVFNLASGHAQCRRGERLISGGLRLRKSGVVLSGPQRVSVVDSGPLPSKREWFVTMSSDLGGAARQDFVVFAYCLAG